MAGCTGSLDYFVSQGSAWFPGNMNNLCRSSSSVTRARTDDPESIRLFPVSMATRDAPAAVSICCCMDTGHVTQSLDADVISGVVPRIFVWI